MACGTAVMLLPQLCNNSQARSSDNDNDSILCVQIIGGKYKGKRTAQKVCVLHLDPHHVDLSGSTSQPQDRRLQPQTRQQRCAVSSSSTHDKTTRRREPAQQTLQLTHSNCNSATAPPSVVVVSSNTNVTSANKSNNKWVKILDGKHKGKLLQYVRHTAQRISVLLPEPPKVIHLLPEHVDMNGVDSILHPSRGSAAIIDPITRTVTTPAAEATAAPEENGNNDDFSQDSDVFFTAIDDDGEDDDDADEDFFSTVAADDLSQDSDVFFTAIDDGEEDDDADDDFFSTVAADEDVSTTVYYDSVGATANPQNAEPETLLAKGDRILIQSGKYEGKTVIFQKRTAKRIAVNLLGEDEKLRYLSPTSLQPDANTMSFSPSDESDPMVQLIRHHLPEKKIRIKNVTEFKRTHTLFGAMFEKSAVFFEMTTSSLDELPRQFANPENTNERLFLASVKLHEKCKVLTCAYLLAASNEDAANELLAFGAFNKLVTRKTAARLELLLSTAQKPEHIHVLPTSKISLIPEHGNVGCGFIPRTMIDALLGKHAPEVCALQVRMVIPRMGIFKGMLMEKPCIQTIELPPSMKKVAGSTCCPKKTDKAWILVNKTGIYPYNARIQQHADSFQTEKPFPVMAQRMLAQRMLAQKGVSQSYLKKPNRQHSNLVGVADWTGCVPPRSVFITGIKEHSTEFGKKIVISRFPMTEAADGLVLPILHEKPPSMSMENWDFLCSKPFGLVVFGNSLPGDRPLPEQIAQGDLDGDGYFVCWDPVVVQDAVIGDAPFFAAKDPPGSPPSSWWQPTQDFMSNIREKTRAQQVIGRMHDCWLRKLDSHFLLDSISFGRAYKEALVAVKHGGKVKLPMHLWSKTPYDLRRYLERPN